VVQTYLHHVLSLVLAAGSALVISAEHVRVIVTCDKVGWVVAAVMVQTSSLLPRWPVFCPVCGANASALLCAVPVVVGAGSGHLFLLSSVKPPSSTLLLPLIQHHANSSQAARTLLCNRQDKAYLTYCFCFSVARSPSRSISNRRRPVSTAHIVHALRCNNQPKLTLQILFLHPQVIFPLDFEKTEASQRFMKAIEGIIRERPDCLGPNSAAAQAAAAAAALDTPLHTPGAGAGPHEGGLPPRPNSSNSSSAFGQPPQQQQQQQRQQQQGPSAIPPSLLLPHELQHAGSLRMHRSSNAMYYSKDPELLPFELNMLEAALGELFVQESQCDVEKVRSLWWLRNEPYA
jgi:hypothetical protein